MHSFPIINKKNFIVQLMKAKAKEKQKEQYHKKQDVEKSEYKKQ